MAIKQTLAERGRKNIQAKDVLIPKQPTPLFDMSKAIVVGATAYAKCFSTKLQIIKQRKENGAGE